MAKTLTLLVTLVVCVVYSSGAAVAPSGTCQNSYDCGKHSCCRDTAGHVISSQQMSFMHELVRTGMCSSKLAQAGEMCDSNCECVVGFECYRPMSGVCCPPMTCHNATWVEQQKKYWANCFSNPGCAVPP